MQVSSGTTELGKYVFSENSKFFLSPQEILSVNQGGCTARGKGTELLDPHISQSLAGAVWNGKWGISLALVGKFVREC